MASPLADVCCASLPAAHLGALAAIRDLPGLMVALAKERALVRWDSGDERVLRTVLPVHGVELYVQREGRWHRFGHHLPAFDFPAQADFRPLCQVVVPAPIRTARPQQVVMRQILFELKADAQPRRTTAMRCQLAELAQWADTVPAAQLAAIQACWCGAGKLGNANRQVLLMAQKLPALAGDERFWGESMLLPLGSRPDPDLPADAIREALGITDEELLLLTTSGAEAIPLAALRPLARASIRLALQEKTP